jgi:hypothetical protein
MNPPMNDAPQDGIGNADNPESPGDDDTKACVEHCLNQEEAAQPARGVVKGGRGTLQVGCAGEAQEAVADVLALQQYE